MGQCKRGVHVRLSTETKLSPILNRSKKFIPKSVFAFCDKVRLLGYKNCLGLRSGGTVFLINSIAAGVVDIHVTAATDDDDDGDDDSFFG